MTDWEQDDATYLAIGRGLAKAGAERATLPDCSPCSSRTRTRASWRWSSRATRPTARRENTRAGTPRPPLDLRACRRRSCRCPRVSLRRAERRRLDGRTCGSALRRLGVRLPERRARHAAAAADPIRILPLRVQRAREPHDARRPHRDLRRHPRGAAGPLQRAVPGPEQALRRSAGAPKRSRAAPLPDRTSGSLR